MILCDNDREVVVYIGNRVRHYRRVRSLSIAKLAAMIDIDPTYLTRIEKGTNMSAIVLCRIAHELDIGIDDIFPKDLLKNQKSAALEESQNIS